MTTTTIHFLPVELITRIFVLGANFDYPYTDSPFLFKPVQNTFYNSPPQDFQITVSQICRGWRTIALRTSCLWSTLHFHEPLHINRARVFLSRCRPESATTFDILISTVAQREHIPNRWRAFHLKIRNNDCKLLETLQLYHFEDFDSSADLYIATYRRPVTIFSNDLPRIKNVSLIGVNLPWDESPYLHRLESLELALHLDNVRPSYIYWDNMLRGSPSLRRLLLHYSGPRISDGTQANAWPSSVTWPTEQSYSNVVGMLIGVRTNSSRAVSVHKPLPNLHLLVDLTITALECSLSSFSDLIRSLVGVQRLDIDFSRVCGGEGWKVFIAASEGDDDQASGYGLDSREWWLFCRADVGARGNRVDRDDDEDAEDEDEGEDDYPDEGVYSENSTASSCVYA
ncbi:hypothetical protein BDZ89DRAFT_1094710 [Hymenopellis radicata]|nr:hypothetical protein BDZ89DRAFT_1094710 [Hymenopellis radicata]